jgi:hypothetical protein
LGLCKKKCQDQRQSEPCCGPRSRPVVPQLATRRSGPIEAKHLKFGTRGGPKPGVVIVFDLGAFGELSNSCCRAVASARPSHRWGFRAPSRPRRVRQEDAAVKFHRALKEEELALLGFYGATQLGSPHPGPLSRPIGALPRRFHGRHARAGLCFA